MKKLSIRRIFSLTLLLLFLLCGSGWAANFNFTDNYGQWWSGSDISITFDWSAGPVVITDVDYGSLSQSGIGSVGVSLDTDSWLKSYSLDASAISGPGPVISVTDIPFFPFTNVSANSNDDFFVAWDLDKQILMLYYGDPNCYTYLGLDFSPDWSFIPAGTTSLTFTANSVEAVLGQQLCSVPIPGAIWLLSSGLFGLVCIRRRNKS